MTLVANPQAMPDTITPAIPPLPAPLPDREATPAEIDAWWRQYDIYVRAVGEVNRVAAIAASNKHAQAQADTAAAMDRAAESQLALIRELTQTPPLAGAPTPDLPPDAPTPDLPPDAMAEILAFVRRNDAMLKSY
jgi:hypothetical protein